MGFHLTIYRERFVRYDDKIHKIKLMRGNTEVPLINPVKLYEEFYLGKGIFPIHFWFIRYAKEVLDCDDDSDTINIDGASGLYININYLIELRDTIKKVLDNPELKKELLPCPKYVHGVVKASDEDYCVEDLKYPYKLLNGIIEEDSSAECVSDYIYEAG